jgi:plasmid stabilization system protein ParE
MSRIVRVLATAVADIDYMFGWLARRSPPGAVTWYAALSEALARISDSPDHYSLVAESSSRWNRRIQQALFKTTRGRRYRIIFEATDTEVRILRVRGPGQAPLRKRDL